MFNGADGSMICSACIEHGYELLVEHELVAEAKPKSSSKKSKFKPLSKDDVMRPANIIQAQLLFLESVDADKDIQLYINSPGGSVSAGLGIYDTMQLISCDVATICTGMAASMGAVLLTAGAAGKRSALPHSRVMIHQPLGGVQGQASDIEITAREIAKTKQELYEILASHSGKSIEKIEADADRDYWLTALEAQEYGLIDKVLSRR